MARTGTTGGGRGTNQFQVKGRAAVAPVAPALAVAAVPATVVDTDPLGRLSPHTWGPDRGPDAEPPAGVVELLDLERDWWKHASSKEQAVRDITGMAPARHQAVVDQAIDRDDALAYDRLLVKRLRRMRDYRDRQSG